MTFGVISGCCFFFAKRRHSIISVCDSKLEFLTLSVQAFGPSKTSAFGNLKNHWAWCIYKHWLCVLMPGLTLITQLATALQCSCWCMGQYVWQYVFFFFFLVVIKSCPVTFWTSCSWSISCFKKIKKSAFLHLLE